MRRSLLTTTGAMAVALAAPSVAMAHRGHRHHHHKPRANAHHEKFRLMHIDDDTAIGTPGSLAGVAPLTEAENAGMVASYTNEILTLTLGGGSTVSGRVTSDTRTWDTSLFVPGAIVRAAELRIGPGGGEFESVWLVR